MLCILILFSCNALFGKACKLGRCCCKVEDVDFLRKELAKIAACFAAGGMEIAVEKQSPQTSAESVVLYG